MSVINMQRRKMDWLMPIAIAIVVGGMAQAVSAAETASNHQGGGEFYRFFVAGGWLVWVVLLPLSLASVCLIAQYLLLIRRTRLLGPTVGQRVGELLEAGRFQSAVEFLRAGDSMLARSLHVGLGQRENGRDSMDRAMGEIIEQEATGLLRRIEWLNIIGNVAPMIGLFGTVWGMIDAFNGIVQAGGQPEPADLAGGISIALVTTWWGLIVAIPALATYGFLRNRIDSLSAEAVVVGEELMRRVSTKA